MKGRFDRKSRINVTKAYVRYTMTEYTNCFGDCHVPGDVMTAVANAACQAFSVQLADTDCDLQNPTHVSSVLKLSEHI